MAPATRPPPPTDRAKLEELFRQLDANKDGRIDLNELKEALQKRGISRPGLAEVSNKQFCSNLFFAWFSIAVSLLCHYE